MVPITTQIDDEVKAEASAVLASMGLTIPDAIRMLLTKVAQDHQLPFDPFVPNADTVAAMMEARRDALPSARNMDQFLEAMNADD